MKAQILVGLAALAPFICEAAAPFAKPLILDFYQKIHEKTGWWEEPASTIDDGVSPNEKDPYYLNHMKWISADDPKRQFIWLSDAGSDLTVSLGTCTGISFSSYIVQCHDFWRSEDRKPHLQSRHTYL